MTLFIRVVVAFAIVTFLATGAYGQTTWFVDDDNCPGPGTGTQVDPFCMIRDGMDAAVNGDEVVVASGTYREKINFNGKAITLRSSDGAAVTTIDGTGLNDSVVKCVNGEGPDTVLDGFTITGGYAFSGSGMFNSGSSPTVTNCTFTGNSAAASTGGGGMANFQSDGVTVSNCTFTRNTAFDGGGMFNIQSDRTTVTNCTFTQNSADEGSAIAIFQSRGMTVSNCSFRGNSAAFQGGGISNVQSDGTTVSNCSFSGNSAMFQGGGISNFQNDGTTVANCILWGDFPNEIVSDRFPSIRFSDVKGGLPTGATDGGGNISADPLFVQTANGDLRLSPGSPCIDAADNAAVPGDNADLDDDGNTTEPTPLDLDEKPRFIDDLSTADTGNGTAPIVDMGAFEFQVCGNGVIDFGEACDDGNTQPGDGCDATCQIEVELIPTVSAWGLIVLGLLFLSGAKICFGRRRPAQT